MHARAAGERFRSRRQTSATGRWTDGCRLRTSTREFGILVAAPEHRGTGIGRALVAFAEHRNRGRGRRAMQLELLLPREWQHPSKEFLKAWYGRLGYRLIRTTTIDDSYPHLAPLPATPCDFAIHEKPLQAPGDVVGSRRSRSFA